MQKRILICTAQVPFARGGAELLVEGLRDALRHAGHHADIVALPFTRTPHRELLSSALAWRMLDLTNVEGEPIDQVICTKFPSYAVYHPRKVVWLVHQHRQVYDWRGTRWSDWGSQDADPAVADAIMRLDRRSLAEATRRFTISRVVSERLSRFNGLNAAPLYPPSRYTGRLHHGRYDPYIVSISRLDHAKRLDLLIKALAFTHEPVQVMIGGIGEALASLQRLAQSLKVHDRVMFRGWLADDELIELYAHARAVFYAPIDEDFGFATIEAFEAGKPVVTAHDSGAVLDFVRDGETGFVVPPDPRAIAARLDVLWQNSTLAHQLGMAGSGMIKDISWQNVLRQVVV